MGGWPPTGLPSGAAAGSYLAATGGKCDVIRPAKRSARSTPPARPPNVPVAPRCSCRCTRWAREPAWPPARGKRACLASPGSVSAAREACCSRKVCWVQGLKLRSVRSNRLTIRRPIESSTAWGASAGLGSIARWTAGTAAAGGTGAAGGTTGLAGVGSSGGAAGSGGTAAFSGVCSARGAGGSGTAARGCLAAGSSWR